MRRHIVGLLGALVVVTAMAAAVFAQAVPAPEPQSSLAQGKRVTLTFNNIAAADAISQFRWLAQVPVIFAPPPATARITLSMLNVPLDEALNALCGQIKYAWSRVGAMYVLMPAQRQPLLPGPNDIADRMLYPDRQRLDAARLMLTLTRSQVARVSQGESLKYAELSLAQQDLLGGIYRRLTAAARAGRVRDAPDLVSAPTEPPESLAFSIRGYVWRLEGGAQPSQRPPAGAVPAQPAPATGTPGASQQPSPASAPEESPASSE